MLNTLFILQLKFSFLINLANNNDLGSNPVLEKLKPRFEPLSNSPFLLVIYQIMIKDL